MAQPVQTRVPVLVQEEAEQVAVEDIIAGSKDDLGVGNNPHFEEWGRKLRVGFVNWMELCAEAMKRHEMSLVRS